MRFQELEKRERDSAIIAAEARAQKIGDMFWQQQQLARYPNISANFVLPSSNNDTVLAVDNT